MDQLSNPAIDPRRATTYYTVRYAVIGAAFGILFPLIGTIIVMLSYDLGASPSAIFEAQAGEPLLWIIDTAPLFLGVFAALAGRREDRLRLTTHKLQDTIESLEERVEERTRDLKQAVEVGQEVTQVVDLEHILSRSVDLVQEAYNLEQVELYLADTAGTALSLQSRSSKSDAPAIVHKRRIPLGFETLIGTAAIEKQITTASLDPSPESTDGPPSDYRTETAVPLLVGSKLIGVLNLHGKSPGYPGSLTRPGLEAFAGQLAIAIENARLVSHAQETQSEIEEQARQLARLGWQDFLNAIDRKEVLGFAYDEERLEEIEPGAWTHSVGSMSVPIQIAGQTVGHIYVQDADYSESDAELVKSVAQQVAQQVENLRLLAEADRYRDEAEMATRRLIREGWDDYIRSRDDTMLGYAYHMSQVSALPDQPDPDSDELLLSRDLVVQGETIGRIEVAEGDSDDEDVNELVEAVADQLSAHLESLRLSAQTEGALAETEKQAHRLAALNELGQALAGAATIEEVFRIVAARTRQILPADRTSIAMLSEGGESFEILALHGEKGVSRVGDVVSAHGSALGIAFKEGRVVIVNETTDSGFPGIESFIVAPLRSGGRTFGALNIGSYRPKSYGQQEISLMVQLASLLASAIESRRLFAQTERRAKELAVLNEMGQALTSTMQVDAVAQSLFEHTSRLIEASSFNLVLFDEKRNGFNVYEFGQKNASHHYPVVRALTEYVISNSRPLLLHGDIAAQLAGLGLEADFEGTFAASWLGVPLVSGREISGAIIVQDLESEVSFSTHHRDLLEAVASQAAIALENARLFEQIQARARRERILRQVTARVRGTTDVDSVMRAAAKEVGQALGRQSFVYLGNGEPNEEAKSQEKVEKD